MHDDIKIQCMLNACNEQCSHAQMGYFEKQNCSLCVHDDLKIEGTKC